MKIDDSAYRTYWARKALLNGPLPGFPVLRWWKTDGLSPIEERYFNAIRDAESLLDIGAGNLRVKRLFQGAGYRGLYHTLDPGPEFEHDYRDLADVQQNYDAIIILDVIEHLPLNDGLGLIDGAIARLNRGGNLIVQTPNARCISNPMGWDMTHRQLYNLPELWAYVTASRLLAFGLSSGTRRGGLRV
jgi:hypothetical protein